MNFKKSYTSDVLFIIAPLRYFRNPFFTANLSNFPHRKGNSLHENRTK